jgi:hypothetical protein
MRLTLKVTSLLRRGLLVEAWKITKVVDIKLLPAPAGSLIPYKLSIEGTYIPSPFPHSFFSS